MKRLTVILLSLVACTAQAITLGEKCGNTGKLSHAIMEARQAGVSFDDSMKIAKEARNPLVEYVVNMAYTYPVKKDQLGKHDEANRFAGMMVMRCFKTAED